MPSIADIVTKGKTLDVGDVANITITTKDENDALADPTTLAVTVQPVGGSAVTYTYLTDPELTKTSTGIFQLLYTIASEGRHYVRAVTTGNVGAQPGYFDARRNPIT